MIYKTPTAARLHTIFLAHAIGDSMGRDTEFVSGDRVRTMEIRTGKGEFKWTDDTHMGLYLAQGLMSMDRNVLENLPAASDLDPENDATGTTGTAIANAWMEWMNDPAKAGTAPGGTCSSGARALLQGNPWHSSGRRTSDGCGAIMRVAACAAFDPDIAWKVGILQSISTHAHPNALLGAAAGAYMLAVLTDGVHDALSPREQLICAMQDADARLSGEGGTTANPTRRMLDVVTRLSDQDFDWLPESKVPLGDGGWRTTSALGIGLLAALCWGFDDKGQVTKETFALAIEKAARTFGDSDSIACITGMFLGSLAPLEVVESHPGAPNVRDLGVIQQISSSLHAWASGEETQPIKLSVRKLLAASRASEPATFNSTLGYWHD